MRKTIVTTVTTLCCLFFTAAQGHELSVDIPFTPHKEVAGIDSPPYTLEDYFSGDLGRALFLVGCSPKQLTSVTIGQWLEMDADRKSNVVNCVMLVLGGRKRLQNLVDVKKDFPTVPETLVSSLVLLSELHRPPYNLSAAELISGTLVVLGLASPHNRRSFMRTIAE